MPSMNSETYPKNSEQWWKMLDDNWSNIEQFLPRFLKSEEVSVIKIRKNNRHESILKLLNKVYDDAPDEIYKENLAGWRELCILLDEEEVLQQR